MSSLAQRRKEQAEEKERVKNRLATMEPLLQHTYVRLDESPADRAIAHAAAQQLAAQQSAARIQRIQRKWHLDRSLQPLFLAPGARMT